MHAFFRKNLEGSRFITHGLAAVGALLFGLGFGLNYGASNENTYLVGGLHLLDRGVLANDWLVTRTTAYHRLFAYPVAALFYLDRSGHLFAVANVLVLAIGAFVVFELIRAIVPGRQALLAFLLVVLLALATRTLSVADSSLYTQDFEPSTLGVTGFLLGMLLFMRGRYLLSGLALAAGGILHANYLLLAFPVFLAAHLLVRRRRVLRPLLRQFALPAVALVALLPVMFPIALQPGSAGTSILLTIRSPHHYQPATFRDQFVPFLGWLLLLLTAVRRDEVRKDGLAPHLALAAAMTALVAVGSALTTFVYIPSVAQAYVWRLAPLVVILVQICTMRMVVGWAAKESAAPGAAEGATDATHAAGSWLLTPLVRVVLVVAAAECFVYYYYLRHFDRLVLEVFAGVLIVGTVAWSAKRATARAQPASAVGFVQGDGGSGLLANVGALSSGRARGRTVAVSLLALATLGVVTGTGLRANSNLLAPPSPESQLYAWARTSPADSIFLIPPDMDDFRLSSQRAVVVDWKSTPFAPAELEEWYRRVDAVSGGVHPHSVTQAAAGYGRLSPRRLADLADMYAAGYVVLRLPAAGAPPPSWPVVYANERYEVLRTAAAPLGG